MHRRGYNFSRLRQFSDKIKRIKHRDIKKMSIDIPCVSKIFGNPHTFFFVSPMRDYGNIIFFRDRMYAFY